MSTHRRVSLLLALLLLFTPIAGLPPVATVVAEADDTPTTLATDILSDFTLGSGLLYWAKVCPGGEFTGPGFLRRMPAGGGTAATLSTTTAADCETFYAMAVAPEGLYYYSYEDSAILFRPSATPYDPPTVILGALDTNNGPTRVSKLSVTTDSIYWGSYDASNVARIHRVKKDGTDHQILYTGGGEPYSVVAAYGVVLYLEPAGLYYVPNCTTGPCGRTQLSTVGGRSLDVAPGTGMLLTAFQLFWTDSNSNPDRIMRLGCTWSLTTTGGMGDISCGDTTSPYSAPDNIWNIGQVRTAGGNLYWPERQAGDGPTDGRVRRMPSAGGTVDDILTNARQLDIDLSVDSLYVYFATEGNDPGGLPGGLFRLPLNASAIVRDLRGDWLEVTQGIQNRGNTVPLTAGKTTYVRGYGLQGSGPSTAVVSAVLHGTRGGATLPGSPLSPLNGTLSLATGAGYDRGNLDESWLFRLPPAWTEAGAVTFRLEVDPQRAFPDPNLGNNSTSQTLTFVGKGPVCTVFVPVRTHAPRPSTNDPNFGAMMDLATRMWPARAYWGYYQTNDVAELQTCWWGPFPYPCYGPYEMPDDSWKVLLSLATRDVFTDDPDECDDAGGYTHYVGMVHPSTNTSTGTGTTLGSGYYDRSAAWVKLPQHSPTTSGAFDFPLGGVTLAHELGHNANRYHVDCGGPDDPDTSYPYPTNQISAIGQNNYYGFDVRTQTVIAPDAASDLMSYCHPTWTSDYTWRALFNWLDPGAAAAMSTAVNLAAAANAVYVSGGVDTSAGSGTLNYAYVYPTSLMSSGMLAKWQAKAVEAAAGDATYQVRVRDASDAVLATQTVVPLVDVDAPATESQGFIATFAAPAGNAAKLELLADDAVIATLSMGPAVPTVTVGKPTAGETVDELLRVEWTATDADSGDDLQYTLQYSPDDGSTWLSLITDYTYPGNGTKVYEVAQPNIPATAGPNTGRIRVLASDGYNTGVGTSAGFTVPNRKPQAFITSPSLGQSFAADEPVILRGLGFDVEDGGLTGASLVWGLGPVPFGVGSELTYVGVPPGEYPLGLAAIDSQNATTIVTTTLSVAPLSIPTASVPSMDGYCSDEAYSEAVEVPLVGYVAGDRATVRLLRTDTYLWACFSNLKPGAATPGAAVGLAVDPNLSRDPLAQADDYAFLVGENGGVYSLKGTGSGGFELGGPSGFEAQVAKLGDRWTAELRIHKDGLGGWDHMVGMLAAHLNVNAANNDFVWPLFGAKGKPELWARTALGDLPHLASMSPDTVLVGGPEFTLTLHGRDFTVSSIVLWEGDALAITYDSANQLRAQVPAAKIATVGTQEVWVKAGSGSPLESNHLKMVIAASAPSLTAISPDGCDAGHDAMTMAVTGSGFTANSQVLWDGEPLATTFVDGMRLNALVPAALVSDGCTAGVTVLSGGPDGGSVSNAKIFTVQPEAAAAPPSLYLPFLHK